MCSWHFSQSLQHLVTNEDGRAKTLKPIKLSSTEICSCAQDDGCSPRVPSVSRPFHKDIVRYCCNDDPSIRCRCVFTPKNKRPHTVILRSVHEDRKTAPISKKSACTTSHSPLIIHLNPTLSLCCSPLILCPPLHTPVITDLPASLVTELPACSSPGAVRSGAEIAAACRVPGDAVRLSDPGSVFITYLLEAVFSQGSGR